MTNSIKTLLAVFLVAGAVRAAPVAAPSSPPLMLRLQEVPQYGPSQEFRSTNGRTTMGVIASDALYGAVIGVVIGSGVALINDDFNNGGWGRDLAIGAGVGLIVGGIVGALNII